MTAYTYDALQRLRTLTLPDTSSLGYRYNALGQLTNTTDPSGNNLTNWYDNQRLLVVSSNAYGQVARKVYDVWDRPPRIRESRPRRPIVFRADRR
jgi:YD repeat-containing protein